jgi:hypothetical protein
MTLKCGQLLAPKHSQGRGQMAAFGQWSKLMHDRSCFCYGWELLLLLHLLENRI